MKLDNFPNGTVRFIPEIIATPETKKTTGNTTIINKATTGRAAYFEVSFFISETHEVDEISASNMFHWKCAVPATKDARPYFDIESAAAHQIAPLLRELADLIDESVANTDKETAERKKTE